MAGGTGPWTNPYATSSYKANSVSWNFNFSRFEISIEGTYYYYTTFITIITLSGGRTEPVAARTASLTGDLIVYLYDENGTLTPGNFQFVTHRVV